MSASSTEILGVVGFYDSPESIVAGMKQVRSSGKFKYFDAMTPFPVHGLEAAQGLKRSFLPYITFIAGLTGAASGFGLEYYCSAVSWPHIIGGKPFNSWPAFVPIMFECTILFAGIATVVSMILINGLPNIKRKSADPGLTRDRFAIVIENPNSKKTGWEFHGDHIELPFDAQGAQQLLQTSGAKEVRPFVAEGWFG